MSELTKKQLERLKRRIEVSVKLTDRENWQTTATRMRDLYKGNFWPDADAAIQPFEGEHRVTINMAQVNTDIIVSSIAYSDPEFMLIPQDPQAAETVPYQKQALQKVWNEIDALHSERQRLKDSVIYGLGVSFVGWRWEEEDSHAQEGTRRPDYLPQEGDLPTLVMQDGGLMAPPPDPTPAEELDGISVAYDNPTIRRVKPYRFYVDPDHDDLENLRDAAYVFEAKILPLDAVKANPNYTHTRDLKGDSRITVEDDEREEHRKHKTDEQYVRVYDYWERQTRRHIVIVDGQWDKPILDEEWPYRFNSYPFVTLVYRDIPDEQLPQGAIQPAETSILSYNVYRSRQINHDDQMGRGLMGYDASKLTEDGKAVLKGDETGGLVECNGSFNEAVGPIAMAPLTQDFYLTQRDIKEDGNVAMAVNDYQKGAPDTTRRTLGEVDRTISLSASRAQAFQRDYERSCERDANLVLQLLQDERFCDSKRWLAMTGGDPDKVEGLEWNAESIKGQSDVRVVCNSTRVQTPESMQQTMAFALQSLMAYVQSGVVNPAPFLKKLGQAFNLTPQELQEFTLPQNGGQQMQQGMEQMGAVVQQIVPAVQGLMQEVEQLKQVISQNAVDAKTQMDMAVKQQQMQQDAEKFQLTIQQMQEKHALEMRQAEVEMQLKIEAAQDKARIAEDNAQVDRAIKAKTAQSKA